MRKLKWNFTKKIPQNNKIAALRVRFMNALNPAMSNEMYIRIPEGGRCEYSSQDRTFYIYGADDVIFRNVHAPEDSAIDISYIAKDHLDILDLTNPEYFDQKFLN